MKKFVWEIEYCFNGGIGSASETERMRYAAESLLDALSEHRKRTPKGNHWEPVSVKMLCEIEN
jgi:hypothetical protein